MAVKVCVVLGLPTVRVPTACTRFWLSVPAARTAVVRAVNVIVISWFSAMLAERGARPGEDVGAAVSPRR